MASAPAARAGGDIVSLWRAALAGAAGFVLAALVLKPLGLQATGLPDGGWAFVAVGALSVGLLEEGTRAALLRWLGWPVGRTLAGLALGWALAELLLVGVAGGVQLMLLASQPDLLARAMAELPPPAADVLTRQVSAVIGAGSWIFLALPLERLAAFNLQIAFTALLAGAGARSGWMRRLTLLGVMGLHAAVDVPAAGFQAGLWPPAPVQVLYALIGLALAPWAWRWCRAQLRPAAAPTAPSAASD